MELTLEEKIMYGVMKAIYESGIPIDFKGSMVLKACLSEAGYNEEIRHTVDIDANWYSDNAPTEKQLTDSLQKALDAADINLSVNLYRMYGEGRSAGFEISDRNTREIIFTMDMDVNRPTIETKIYEIEKVCFRGASVNQMLADKISTISTDKVFRRVKDVVDLYYLSKIFPICKEDILRVLKANDKALSSFNGFLNRKDELEHAYDKFRFAGKINKPPFDEVYDAVKKYLKEMFPG